MSRHHRKLDRRRWERVRLEVLDRDNWTCRRCGAVGRRCEVDHVIPMSVDPHQDPYDPAGLQCLCRKCHAVKSRGETERPDPARDAWRALIAKIANS